MKQHPQPIITAICSRLAWLSERSFGKYDISIVSGAEVHGTTVPDGGATVGLLLIGLGSLAFVSKQRR
jgi:hypothetical protein